MRWFAFLLFALVANSAEHDKSLPQEWKLTPQLPNSQGTGASNSSDGNSNAEIGEPRIFDFSFESTLIEPGEESSLGNASPTTGNSEGREFQVVEASPVIGEGESSPQNFTYKLEITEKHDSILKGRLQITPLTAGSLVVPRLELKNSLGQVLAKSEPFSIEVKSVLPSGEKREAADYIPPQNVAFPYIWFFIISAVLLFVLIWSIYLFAHATRNQSENTDKDSSINKKVLLDPWTEALQDLERLEKEAPWTEKQWKRFGFEISHILKRYIDRLGVQGAEEATTHELFHILLPPESSLFRSLQCEPIKNLFTELDWIKFSDRVSTDEECKRNLKLVKVWIETTGEKIRKEAEKKALEAENAIPKS